jgi:hypothetical protein
LLGAAIPAWPVVTGALTAGKVLLGATPAWPVATGAGRVFEGTESCDAGAGPWAAGNVFGACADAEAAKPKLSTAAVVVPIKRLNVIDAIST